ncbi:MAG TPA: FAD-dependent oxidoreductase [Steroidobacteraceae bacterium]|nr:FAD-dependent oxidoreductase [Steroidobacteraceae bacterium]
MTGTRYDLIVVGGGIVGAACADAAVGEGLHVAIIEPGPVGGGATGASMGHLVAMPESRAALALARYSLGLWERYAELPEAEFHRCGTLWVAREEPELATASEHFAWLTGAGVRARMLDREELRRREPALSHSLAGGLLVPDDATVYPPRMAQWLVDRAAAGGARLYVGRRAQRLEGEAVLLDDGRRLQGAVLIAAGCDTAQLLPQLPLRARKGHLLVTDRYPGVLRHQVLELGYTEGVRGEAASSVAFNLQPRPTGQLLIGSSRELDATDAAVSRPMLRRMLERAFSFMPLLRELHALRAWTGFRPTSADGLPYLGEADATRRIWIAAGHEGLGVTTAFGSARILLDLFMGRTPAIDPTPYLPARVLS